MGECKHCVWADSCGFDGNRCEYFYSCDDQLEEAEYESELRERVKAYESIVREQQED